MSLIKQILIKYLGFEITTKDCCNSMKKIDGCIVLLLLQVNNFCCRCTDKNMKNIYNLIGTKIQFQSKCEKGDIPFKHLGLIKDFNDTDLVQTKKYIGMNCSNYNNQYLNSNGCVISGQPD